MEIDWRKFDVLNNPTQEELFDIWCQELVEAGYIDEIVSTPNVPTFTLFKGLKKEWQEIKITAKLPNKTIEKSKVLLHSTSYTPDRIIKWNIKAFGVFFLPFDYTGSDWNECYFMPQQAPEGFYYSLIEVKGPTGNQKAYGSDFRFTQKWLWTNTQQYVQKVMLSPILVKKDLSQYLWASTFTPKRFLFSDKLSVNKNKSVPWRTIPNKKGIPLWKVRTLEEFLNKKSFK